MKFKEFLDKYITILDRCEIFAIYLPDDKKYLFLCNKYSKESYLNQVPKEFLDMNVSFYRKTNNDYIAEIYLESSTTISKESRSEV